MIKNQRQLAVDILYFLEDRLSFIQRFYEAAAVPFEDTKRRIDVGEEPFVDKSDPEDYDEPAFLSEYQEADDCLHVLGYSCLGMVGRCLQNYMSDFLKREGVNLLGLKGKSWFDRHRQGIEENTHFSWDQCPVKRDQIEEIILTRNDIEHGSENTVALVTRRGAHFRKYPESRFVEDWEIDLFRRSDGSSVHPGHLRVTREKLASAIADVRAFCTYVDAQRTKWW